MRHNKPHRYNNPAQAILSGISNLSKKKHERVGALTESDRLDGKTVLITGASSGLGLATAKELANRGARVLMACRSGIPEKGMEVQEYSGSQNVFMLQVDLSDFDSIKNLVEKIRTDYKPIDILICNAAVVARQNRQTRHALDERFTVNYLAKYLLVRNLLKHNCFNTNGAERPRIIFVSSESHRNPENYDWENFGKYQTYTIKKSVSLYGYFKLLMTTFAVELSRKLNQGNKAEYSVFALCPGPVNTNIAREAPKIFMPLLKLIFRLSFRSPERASEPVVYLAASKDVEGKTLDYLYLMSRKSIDDKAMNEKNGKKLWELSETLLQQKGIEC